jgi:glycosyltransferase involved in cell wall biosynthesis
MNFQMKVLLLTKEFGGHEKMLLEWLKEALKQGLHIDISCRNITELKRESDERGLTINQFAYDNVDQRACLWATFCELIATLSLLRRISHDHIILFAPGVVQLPPWHSLMASLLGYRVASYIPMAYKSSDMRFRYAGLRDWFIRQLIRHVDIWITISEQQRQLLKGQWRIKAPIYVVPNRLELPHISKIHQSNSVCENRPTRVLFIGRFEPNQKGLDWLVDELRRNSASWVGRIEFIFQGKGEFEQVLRQLALEMPNNAVRIAPWGDVKQELLQADALLLPSRFEGFPLVAVEAAYYGIPIIASDKAGLSDVLPSESIFPFGDFESLMRSIDRIKDPFARSCSVNFTLTRMQSILSLGEFEQCVKNIVTEFVASTQTKKP